jgi:hypothetical protein
MRRSVASPGNKTQTFGGPASAIPREFGGDKHADFMLRMRLSLDCGCAAVDTQGGSDNLFTVESLTALTRVSRRVTLSSARRSQGERGRAERAFTGSVTVRHILLLNRKVTEITRRCFDRSTRFDFDVDLQYRNIQRPLHAK